MNGTAAQTISGSGSFSDGATAGYLTNLTINNTTGSNIDLQMALGVSAALTLTKGVLITSNSSSFTMGKTGGTLVMTRTEGSMTLTPASFVGTINAVYGNGSAVPQITTGNEIPASFNKLTNISKGRCSII
jgi:hypothetical protein